MSQQDDLSHSLEELSIEKKAPAVKKTNATYDKVALRERWNILGKDAEQSKSFIRNKIRQKKVKKKKYRYFKYDS